MKKLLSLAGLVVLLMASGCETYVYGPGVGWGPYHHHRHWDAAQSDDVGASDALAGSASALSQSYGIAPATAVVITDFAAGRNMPQILKQTGVTENDLAPLRSLKMPSDEVIQTIAAHFGENPAKIRQVFSDFILDVKADALSN